MLTPEQVERNLNEVSERLRPAVLTDSQLNVNILVNHFHATGKEMTVENLFESMTGVLKAALQWAIEPEPVSPLTPSGIKFIDAITNKLQIQDMPHEIYRKWMTGPHKAAFQMRINEIQDLPDED